MNSPNPTQVTPPAATIPWYKADIVRGLVTMLVAQLLARLHVAAYISNEDVAALAPQIVEWILDGISGAAWLYAMHARATKPVPPIAISKAAAEKANNPPFPLT